MITVYLTSLPDLFGMPQVKKNLFRNSYFRIIFNNSPLSTIVFDLQGKCIFVNKAWEQLWRIDPIVFTQTYNIFTDKKLLEKNIVSLIREAFQGKTIQLPAMLYQPSNILPNSGQEPAVWIKNLMYPITNEEGKIILVVLQQIDITTVKTIEEIQARHISIVSASNDAIIEHTLNGTITRWNEAAKRIFGYSETQAVGQNIAIIIPKELLDEEKNINEKIKKGKHISQVKTIRKMKNNKRIYVSLSISPIKNSQGIVIGATKIIRDITEQIQIEKKLIQSQRQYQLVIEHTTDLITVVDAFCNFVFASPSHVKILGYTPDELVGKNAFSMIHPDDLSETKSEFEKAIRGEIGHATFRFRHKLGNWLTLEAAGLAIHDDQGKSSMVVITSHDITERIVTEKRKDDFLNLASHELKTPITSIKMYLRILENELKKASYKKAITVSTKITGQADKLTELVNDLLDVSRIQSGKLHLRKEQVDLNDLIDEIINILQETTTSKIHFIKTSEMKLSVDQYRLYQVLTNLLSNAIKYSPKNGDIIVKLTDTDEFAIVSVQDFGIGIEKSFHDKIFDKLYQIPEEKTNTFPGLGMGLYISKEIIERHGGKIWLQSDKGKGATFFFSLPLLK